MISASLEHPAVLIFKIGLGIQLSEMTTDSPTLRQTDGLHFPSRTSKPVFFF